MIIPLGRLIDYEDNVYELTNAAIRRAIQITVTGKEELEDKDSKIISNALNQILTKKVEYIVEEA
ncbi:MAG: DNA-directed RNA polymerase subunit omega [Spirochaetia bacterium]